MPVDGAVSLDPASTDAGDMERLFLLEAVTPGQRGYDAARNLEAMRLMRQTIENRLKSPAEYNARGAKTRTDIVELGNQFAGFGGYPVLSRGMQALLDDILRIANDPKDRRQAGYLQYVRDAITAATESVMPVRARYPGVTGWRTVNRGKPGPRFRTLTTLSGNTFFSTDRVPPMPRRGRPHRSPARH